MKKNIMVVDDSALMRRVMCDIINSDSSFEVIDVSRDGQEAYDKIVKNKYDAIVLDINMPRMDGLELLEKLHKEKIKCLVVMASTMTTEGSKETIRALELGAIDFVTKPGNVIEARGDDFESALLNVLYGALFHIRRPKPQHESKDLSASAKSRTEIATVSTAGMVKEKLPEKSTVANGNKLVALACSTGGPKSLQSVIPKLPKNMDAPLVLVQHMPKGFTKSMADRLNELSEVYVKEAEEGDVLQKGHVYVAPGGRHMLIQKCADGSHKVHLDDSPAIGGLRPCADLMYDSLRGCGYDEVCCVVLTGMGADGTKGILELRRNKKIFTISQDESTCVVYGMPRAIAESGAVNQVVSLDNVANTIIKNVGVR